MKKLNFGCGMRMFDGWDNVDIQKSKGIFKNFDFNCFPYPIYKNSYDYILVDNILEHLLFPKKVLLELHRICKKNAII
ncbi:unnamed protein product, partial [marine sediment metagenome]